MPTSATMFTVNVPLTGTARVAGSTRMVTVPRARSGDAPTATSTMAPMAQRAIIPDRNLLARASLRNTFCNMAPSFFNLRLYYTIFPALVKDKPCQEHFSDKRARCWPSTSLVEKQTTRSQRGNREAASSLMGSYCAFRSRMGIIS